MPARFWIHPSLRFVFALILCTTVLSTSNSMVVLFCVDMEPPRRRPLEVYHRVLYGQQEFGIGPRLGQLRRRASFSLYLRKIGGILIKINSMLRRLLLDWSTTELSTYFKLWSNKFDLVGNNRHDLQRWSELKRTFQGTRPQTVEDVDWARDFKPIFREELPQVWEVVDWSHQFKHMFKEASQPDMENTDWRHELKHLFREVLPRAWEEVDWSHQVKHLFNEIPRKAPESVEWPIAFKIVNRGKIRIALVDSGNPCQMISLLWVVLPRTVRQVGTRNIDLEAKHDITVQNRIGREPEMVKRFPAICQVWKHESARIKEIQIQPKWAFEYGADGLKGSRQSISELRHNILVHG